jgi:CHAD domain-containing protein
MAKARPIPDLSAEEPMAFGAARILAVRTEELLEHSRDVLDLGDIEKLHSMRVATRRLRAALEVFEACFPRKLQRTVLSEVKELADALGERRDRDVAIGFLGNFSEQLSAPDRRGISSLIVTLKLEQADANEALRPFVATERVESLCERLRELAEDAQGSEGRTKPGVDGLFADHAGNGTGTLG